ncbi:MAG: restriction endonuclease subunit S [Alphaproteobacteria bacterium]|nr:restriction endonuclease subunit S [Alphaproteobacteria bacterium]
MSSWQNVFLSDIATIVPGFAFKSDEFCVSGIPVVKIKNITPPFIDLSDAQFIDNSNLESKLDKFKLTKGDFCIAMTGETIGKVGKYISDDIAYLNQRVCKVVPKPGIDKSFIYYSLVLPDFYSFVQNNIDSQSAQANISHNALGRYPILLPAPEEQKAIAGVLGALDNKIEAARRGNETLEAIAAALFKSWFVDFEPFGGIKPNNWLDGRLADIIGELESGSRPKGGAESSGVPSIGAENIEGFGIYDYAKEKFISQSFFDNMRRGKVRSGDVLLYKDGAYVGKVSMALDGFPHETCAVNEHVFILRTNDICPSQFFLYLFISQKQIIETMATLGSAKAAQPGLNQTDVGSVELIIPDKDTIKKFDEIISPMMHKIAQNSIQSRTLAQMRDSLLPRLMSGKIRIPPFGTGDNK